MYKLEMVLRSKCTKKVRKVIGNKEEIFYEHREEVSFLPSFKIEIIDK